MIRILISISFFSPLYVLAQDDLQQTLFKQSKQNIEKSCQSQDFLSCINIDKNTCQAVSDGQLARISSAIESNAKAVAEGQFTQLLKQIKTARNSVLEENGIEVEKANSCGKEFLTS